MRMRRALIIANGEFVDTRLSKLRSPKADAAALKDVLGDKEIGMFEQVTVLEDATESEIKQNIERFLVFEARSNHECLLHISTHGKKNDDGQLFFAASNSTYDFESNWVAAADVAGYIHRSRARAVLTCLDCCFSGSFPAGRPRAVGVAEDLAAFSDNAGQGKIVLTAGSAFEYAFEDSPVPADPSKPIRPSAFTDTIVAYLRTGSSKALGYGSDFVTVDELFDHLQDELTKRDQPQTPEKKGTVTGRPIVIARRSRGAAVSAERYSTLQPRFVLRPEAEEVFCVTVSANDRHLAAATSAGTFLWSSSEPITRWPKNSLPEAKCLESDSGDDDYMYNAQFTPDARRLITVGEDAVVRGWDVQSGKRLWEKRGFHRSAIYALAVHHDGRYFATGSYDKTVIEWSLSDSVAHRIRTDQNRIRARVSSLAYAPPVGSSARKLLIGSWDNRVRLWQIEPHPTWHELNRHGGRAAHNSSVESVAYAPNGKLIATSGLDKTVRVWDANSREELWHDGASHEYLVRHVCFDPMSTTVVSAGWDMIVQLYDAQTGSPTELYHGKDESGNPWPWHKDWIWASAFTSDGRLLLTCGSDGAVIARALPEAE